MEDCDFPIVVIDQPCVLNPIHFTIETLDIIEQSLLLNKFVEQEVVAKGTTCVYTEISMRKERYHQLDINDAIRTQTLEQINLINLDICFTVPINISNSSSEQSVY